MQIHVTFFLESGVTYSVHWFLQGRSEKYSLNSANRQELATLLAGTHQEEIFSLNSDDIVF